jgi:hypothetical protein
MIPAKYPILSSMRSFERVRFLLVQSFSQDQRYPTKPGGCCRSEAKKNRRPQPFSKMAPFGQRKRSVSSFRNDAVHCMR